MQFGCRSLSWEQWNWANSPRDVVGHSSPFSKDFQLPTRDLRASYREMLEEPRPHNVGRHFGENSSLLLPFLSWSSSSPVPGDAKLLSKPSPDKQQRESRAREEREKERKRESHFNEIKHHLQLFIQTDHQCHSQTRCERATQGGCFD